MLHSEAKMHQIQFLLRLRPRPCWRAYSAPPDSLTGFKKVLVPREEKGIWKRRKE